MKSLHTFSALFACALAWVSAPAVAKPIEFSKLPEGKPLSPPSMGAPERIAAGKTVEGIHVAAFDENGFSSPGTVVRRPMVFGSKEAAEQWTTGTPAATYARSCLVSMRAAEMQTGTIDWPVQAAQLAHLYAEFDANGRPRDGYGPNATTAIHVETLATSGSGASLEIVDAWLDPWTSGAELIARASMPLARVGRGPGGIAVFAARDGEKMHVIVKGPNRAKLEERAAQFAQASLGALTLRKAQDGASSDCGHLRFTLTARPGGGEMATAMATVALSFEVFPETGSKTGSALGSVFDVLRNPEAPPPPPSPGLGELRTRGVQINVGLARTSRDSSPVPSVSFGWSGPAQAMMI